MHGGYSPGEQTSGVSCIKHTDVPKIYAPMIYFLCVIINPQLTKAGYCRHPCSPRRPRNTSWSQDRGFTNL